MSAIVKEVMKWISVKERMPARNKYVLVYGEPDYAFYEKYYPGDCNWLAKEQKIHIAQLRKNEYGLLDVLGHPRKPVDWVLYATSTPYWKITHWMPLPEAPVD